MASFSWQHFINQVLATQGNNNNSCNMGARVEEDLAKPYKPSNLSCFSQQIADYDFQKKIKIPSHIKTYDGTEDPEDHLQIFTGAARIERWSNAKCRLMFMQTLVGSARIWFNDLPTRSVRSFDDLSKGFLANFSQQRRYVKDATVIFQIKQRDDESLREFIERYKKEGLTYVGADEKIRVAGFMNAITSKYLTRDFNKSLPKTLEEALERAEAHIRGEEAVDVKEQRKRGSSWRGNNPARKRGNFNSYDRRQKGSEQRRSKGRNPPSRERTTNFTPLTKTPQEILATEEVKQSFRPPRPLPKSRKNENSTQYYEFHEEKGHHTNDCFQLKKRIEEAVKSGELGHLVKGVRDKMTEGKGKEVNMVDFDGKVPHKATVRSLGASVCLLPSNRERPPFEPSCG
ncbi:uncharacterized protein LOC118486570 [Helianthus annuus]|uniref:uncharacterized protein LOC118486570 n=1 Tax=Helianthus annuus TaxID=4232 RepID=UPI0016533634|nr:uncharacterized protein LOC118486570 [Helianthus annuus]